jgi:pimeloyl-ACP methyl ester carboxylesterase
VTGKVPAPAPVELLHTVRSSGPEGCPVRLCRFLAALAIAVLATVVVAVPAHAASGDSNATTPVLYVHGYDPAGSGSNCGMWSNMRAFLTAHGFTGPQVTVKYYYNDAGCAADVNGFGSPTGHYPSGQVNGQDSNNTDIRHIAYQFAWYVHDTYTAQGRNVGIVAHSMGGLVVRYALHRVAAGDAEFPSSLEVSNVVTFGTPHSGASIAGLCSLTNRQCAQMSPGSSFLKSLEANGQDPQAAGGTDWTVMGSASDAVVSQSSATSMIANHSVRYAAGNGITHGDYYNETQTTTNAKLSYSDHGSAYTSTANGEWCVLRAQRALSGGAY